jgi:hypothetical protein
MPHLRFAPPRSAGAVPYQSRRRYWTQGLVATIAERRAKYTES